MPREGQREVHEQEDVARGQPGAGAQRGRGAQAAGLHQQEGGRHRRRGDQGGPGDGGQGALCGVQIKLVGGGEFRNQGDGGEGGPETRKDENVTGKYIASNIIVLNTVYSRRSGPLRVHALLRAAGGGLPARQLLGGVERRALPPRQDAGAVGQGPSEENCSL